MGVLISFLKEGEGLFAALLREVESAACKKDLAEIVDGTDASADGERHKHLFCHSLDYVNDGAAFFMGSGYVEEGDLVSPLLIISSRAIDGIACIAKINEIYPFNYSSVLDVKAGDYAFC
jgi:hypothetical protein